MTNKNWKHRLCALLLALLMLPGIPIMAAADDERAPADYVQALARLVAAYPDEADAPEGALTAQGKGGVPEHQVRRLLAKTADGTLSNDYGAIEALPLSDNRFALQYETGQAAADARKRLKQDPNVLYADPDGVVRASAVSWGVAAIGADDFQAILPAKLPEIKVAVLDSGLDINHKHLTGRISDVRWNFYSSNNDVEDKNGHGTHVAGTVTDASSSNVKVMPLKVLDDNGNGYDSLAMEAVRYAADKGAKIVNMSLGGYSAATGAWNDTVEYAAGHGVAAIFAANGNDCVNDKFYPAAISGVIAVTASESDNRPADFANYGSYVDIGAPGVDIRSSVPGGGYMYGSGTSMATPFASAAAALLLSQDAKLTGADILTCLKSTSTPWAAKTTMYGAGIVNIKPREEVEPSQFTLTEKSCSAFRSVVVCPPITGARFTYTSGNPAVAAVNQSGGVQALRPGDTTITVTAPGFRAEVPVTVRSSNRPPVGSGVTIKSVAMKTPPTKTVYAPGDQLNTAGGAVRVTYSDGVADDIALHSGMCAGFDTNRLGPQTITVDFSGKKLTFTVQVLPRDIPESLALRYNEFFVFPCGEYPGVRWESSNSKVLTVDADGLVEYRGRGSAVVSTVLGLPGGRTETLAQTRVTVSFTGFQWFVYIFLLGFLWM